MLMNKVLFFAHLRDAVGEEFLMLDASGKTVAELKEDLSNTYHLPKMDTVMTAVNEEFAPDEVIIEDGAEIAFIPPVSGG
jgi:molybdopterin synthase sulfur carrier subunit